MLETLNNPGTKEYGELREWLDGDFDPEQIDLRMINARLGLLSMYIEEYERG